MAIRDESTVRVVLYEGELAGEVDPHGATVNEIGLLMAGGSRA